MKKGLFIALAAITTGLMSFTAVQMNKWNYDNAHARLGFSVSHMTVSDCDGYFKDVTATITSSKADLTDAVAEMTAKVASVNTDNAGRDGHLQGADFFDAAKYPTITFKSTSFTKTKIANGYVVKGNLTMHGVTKPVTFTTIIKQGVNPMSKKNIAGFKIIGKINRKDFGVGVDTPNAIVGDVVSIVANAEFIQE
jgi:polyisoprenoid-binding protein YceI